MQIFRNKTQGVVTFYSHLQPVSAAIFISYSTLGLSLGANPLAYYALRAIFAHPYPPARTCAH